MLSEFPLIATHSESTIDNYIDTSIEIVQQRPCTAVCGCLSPASRAGIQVNGLLTESSLFDVWIGAFVVQQPTNLEEMAPPPPEREARDRRFDRAA